MNLTTSLTPPTSSVNEEVSRRATASEPPQSETDALAVDAPVRRLIAKLHEGTTLADRVRRMRGRREGMRLRRLTKAKPIDAGETTPAIETTKDDNTCDRTSE